MAHIEFLDETMRDGQQSLWGLRMQAGMALPVSPLIDRTGFKTIDLATLIEINREIHKRQNEFFKLRATIKSELPTYSGKLS